jgi:flagellar export protein FliJ
MKKFKFKLKAALRYREILKELQEAKVISANNACTETELVLQELEDNQHKVYQSMIENAEHKFSLNEHRDYQVYNQMIITERSKEKTRLAKRKKSLEHENIKLVLASKKLKAMEKLEDKALELHQKDMLALEMKQIDDLVNSRYRVEQ